MVIASTNAETVLSYAQAKQILMNKSAAIQAAQYELDSQHDKRASLDHLGYPDLSISAGVQAYELRRELNIEPLQEVAGMLITGAADAIPSTVDVNLHATHPTASLTSTWPIYTGGRISAAQEAANATIAQAQAERDNTLEHQEKLLASAYFGHTLARNVLGIRQQVLEDVESHLHRAIRFEDEGVLSKVERLHAQVAYDEARRNLEQARADFGIADASLQRLLRLNESVKPVTHLFVISSPLPPLATFIQAGTQNHSKLALIRAKRKEAEQGKVIQEARFKPTVAAYGSYNLAQQNADFTDPLPLLDPDWVIGIKVSYTLFDRQNRRRSISAAKAEIQRIEYLEQELEMGISTFIEKSYRELERARQQYLLLASNIELAQETLTLRERLFEEGLNTSLDVTDARLSAARAKTEQSIAAYAFVLSLVDLLEASGQLQNFNTYIEQADVRLSWQ